MDAGKIAQTPASISANADSRNAGAKIAASVKKAIEEEGSAVKKPQLEKRKCLSKLWSVKENCVDNRGKVQKQMWL